MATILDGSPIYSDYVHVDLLRELRRSSAGEKNHDYAGGGVPPRRNLPGSCSMAKTSDQVERVSLVAPDTLSFP